MRYKLGLSLIIFGILFFANLSPKTSEKMTDWIRINLPPQAIAGEISQTVCPVMGGHIDENLYVDVKGKRIYICCMACEDAIKAEPDKYIKKIEARGETVQDLKDIE